MNKDLSVRSIGKEQVFHVGCSYASKRNRSLDVLTISEKQGKKSFRKRFHNLDVISDQENQKKRQNFNNLIEVFQKSSSEDENSPNFTPKKVTKSIEPELTDNRPKNASLKKKLSSANTPSSRLVDPKKKSHKKRDTESFLDDPSSSPSSPKTLPKEETKIYQSDTHSLKEDAFFDPNKVSGHSVFFINSIYIQIFNFFNF